MARPRKKKADAAQGSLLSLAEEQKAENISEIPVEEQPYPLPKGWKWVRLGDVVSVSKEKTDDFSDKTIRYIGLEHFEKDNGIIASSTVEEIHSTKNIFYPGQILYGRLRPYLNKHDIVQFSGVCSTDILVLKCKNNVLNKFINLFLNLDYFIEFVVSNSKGINLPRVSDKNILKIVFPLSSIEIQQHIVKNIYYLFDKLDKTKHTIKNVLDSFENRRAAILHKAFSGELTNKWREENKKDISSWKVCKLADVASLHTGIMKGRKTSGATVLKPYLRVANVQDGYFNLSEIKQIEVEEEQVTRWLLQKKDVLFTEGGDFDKLGRGAVWEGQIPDCLHQNHVFAVRVKQEILNPYFLSYQAGSPYGKQYFLSCSKQTTNLASINSTQLKKFPVRLPSLLEQQEIVRILDDLLAKEQQIKDTAEAVLAQIELLKKSTLAKAFRGELC